MRTLDYEVIGNSLIHNTVTLGENFKIGAFCVIQEDVVIGNNVTIKNYVEIRKKSYLGNNVKLGSRVTLAAETVISNDCDIKYGCVFTDTPKLGQPERQPCIIREGVKLGANVCVMPGVEIKKNAVVGACSQVRHDLEEGVVVWGNPVGSNA